MTDINTPETSSIVSTPSSIETKWELEEEKPVVPVKSILRQSSVKSGLKTRAYIKEYLNDKQKPHKVSFKTKEMEVHEIDNLEELKFGDKENNRECCNVF